MSLLRLFTTRNVAGWDRLLRAFALPAVIAAWWLGLLSDGWALALGFPAAMLLVTALTGTCSIYAALGVSTRRRQS